MAAAKLVWRRLHVRFCGAGAVPRAVCKDVMIDDDVGSWRRATC